MTAPARIPQADMERAAKAIRNAGWKRAHLTFDLVNQKIEAIVEDTTGGVLPAEDIWSDDDV